MNRIGIVSLIIIAVVALLCFTACDALNHSEQTNDVGEVTLTSIAVTTLPSKTQYMEGESFSAAGMTVTATYSDGSTKSVVGYKIDKTTLTAADTFVVLSYQGKTVTVPVVVLARSMVGIAVTSGPTKTQYTEGEAFDPTGMVVTATYSDGTQERISAYSLDKTTLSATDTAVTVSYQGQTAAVAIRVRAITITGVSITTAPTKTQYTEGETFDPTGMVVTAAYSDGTSTVVTDYTVDTTTPLRTSDARWRITVGACTAYVDILVASGSEISLAVAQQPIKRLYVQGECFDSNGLRLSVTQDGITTETYRYTFENRALRTTDTAVAVTCLGAVIEVPIQVVAGSPMSFNSAYTQQQYDAVVADLAGTRVSNGNAQGTAFDRLISAPYAEGVANVDQFVEQADYYVFYRLSSFVIKVDFAYDDVETLLDTLYLHSEFLASTASITGQSLAGGYVQVAVKYYDAQWIIPAHDSVSPVFVENSRTPSHRSAAYAFSTVNRDTGVTVYTSDQAIYALSHGYAIAPAAGSAAEAVVERALTILREQCDDAMTPQQKMYNLYVYLCEHVVYDNYGDVSASLSLDKRYESDMIGSLFTSFYAEGPLLYGSSVCFGYAKAYTLLLGLEGFDVTRVVAQHVDCGGRSAFTPDGEFYIHSYLYVTLEDNKQYLSDVTFAYAGYRCMADDQTTENNVCLFRYMCLGLTKTQHAQIYSLLRDDRISASATYNPGSFDYLREFTYDGVHDYLCNSQEELDAYFDAMMQLVMADSGSDYYFPVFVGSSVLGGYSGIYNAITDKLDGYSVSRWYRGFSYYYPADGSTYYQAFILIRK